MANQLNNENQQYFIYFSVGAMVGQVIMTVVFRKKQKEISAKIDENNLTPSDFSIIVSNFPLNIENPMNVITEMFKNEAVPGKILDVKKVVLIYNIEEIEEIES